MSSSGRSLCVVLVLVAFQGVVANLVRAHGGGGSYNKKVSMAVDAQGVVTRDSDALDTSEFGGQANKKGEAQSLCKEDEEDSGLEAALDVLSWELLASPMGPGSSHPQLALAAAKQGFAAVAAARVASWMEAVGRSQSLSEDEPHVLPPVCPARVPASDPYWTQVDDYGTHNVCRYSNNCTTPYTNLERVNSIRKTLSVTSKFLQKFDVQHGLYGGSVIGAARCQDVLPWDKDSDVFMLQEDVHKILTLLDGIKDDGTGRLGVHIDMDQFGVEFKGFALHQKFPGCMPFVIVDKSTGFFTDLFPLRAVGSLALVPSVTPGNKTLGEVYCHNRELFNCGLHKCHQWTLENTLPPSECQVGDFSIYCPAKPHPWLVEQFGPDWMHPIHQTRNENNE